MKNRSYSFLFILLTFVGIVFSVSAQQYLTAYKTDNPPVIDGKLDDAVWKNATSVSDFKTFIPDFGKDMTEKTVAYFANDADNLYFAFKAYDREPNKIKSSVSARDKIRSDDWICINLDSFNDHQSLYAIYCNPIGIQEDSRSSSNQEDFSFDMVYYSKGIINEDGYSVELKIPIKSIRFKHGDVVEMAVLFERHISRYSEQGMFPPLDPDQGYAFLNQMQQINFTGLNKTILFEALPAVTFNRQSENRIGIFQKTESQEDLSLTLKYGLTSELIMDGTINPDFSQVEADAGQVDFNQRFALFYPERRPFFIEGHDNFNFACVFGDDPVGSVVHTRNIVNPITGIKLTGKLNQKTTIASIYAMDELSDAAEDDYAHFAITRFKRALSGDSYYGGIYTGRERGNGFNRVGGLDGQFRLTKASFITTHALYSITDDKIDQNKKNLSGHALALDAQYDTRDLYLGMGIKELSSDFQSETGYVTRTDITRIAFFATPKFYPKSNVLQRIDLALGNYNIYDKPSKQWENELSAIVTFSMSRRSRVMVGYNHTTEIFLGEKFNGNGLALIANSQITKQLRFNVFIGRRDIIRYQANPYQGYGHDYIGGVVYQPSDKIQMSLNYTFLDFFRSLDNEKIFEYKITRFRTTYQFNRYLFFRGILEYNSFYDNMTTDFLLSFTYIPGTVLHLGYGSLYEKRQWDDVNNRYKSIDNFHEMKRGLFFKASYLYRL